MKLYVICFEDGSYYVNHDGMDCVIERVYTDRNINCVIGIGREANARALAQYLTAYTGKETEVFAIERETTLGGSIAKFELPKEEIDD